MRHTPPCLNSNQLGIGRSTLWLNHYNLAPVTECTVLLVLHNRACKLWLEMEQSQREDRQIDELSLELKMLADHKRTYSAGLKDASNDNQLQNRDRAWHDYHTSTLYICHMHSQSRAEAVYASLPCPLPCHRSPPLPSPGAGSLRARAAAAPRRRWGGPPGAAPGTTG
jgi:hypothetical protein